MNVSITGQDAIILDNHVFVDLADGDVGSLEFPNEITKAKTGKNGNTLFALNESGRQAVLTMRVLRGSADDKYNAKRLNAQLADFSGTVLMNGSLIKRVGDGTGVVTSDVYTLTGGMFQKMPAGKSNVEGDTEQSVTVYAIVFANGGRIIS